MWLGIGLMTIWVLAKVFGPAIALRSERRLTSMCLHRDQREASLNGAGYFGAIAVHARMLGISAAEFALRASIPLRAAQFLLEHPEQIARIDWWAGIERALLL